MKIDLISDVHAEFSPWKVTKTSDDVETLIMAGDIILIKDFKKHKSFFEQVSKLYKNVIYVIGNHCWYNGTYPDDLNTLRNHLKSFSNIHVLEKQSIEIGDILFIGGCLWTDCNKSDPMTMMVLTQSMNDFRIINNGSVPFTVEDAVKDHEECLKYFRKELGKNKDKKCVVISHHAPSFGCINEIYHNEHHLNYGYFSNLDQFILDRKQIKVWVHGHVHIPVDFFRGTCRILSNPRGYCGIERNSDSIQPYLPKNFEV